MKSCRNCNNSTHLGSYNQYDLVCKTYGKIVVAWSVSPETNKTSDAHACEIANDCPEYTEEPRENK